MRELIAICAAIVLVGCSTTKSGDKPPIDGPSAVQPGVDPLLGQRLSTTFNRRGVKFEWNCIVEKGLISKTCVRAEITAIEITAYATSNGNSENSRELAFRVGEAMAKAKLRHFINEEIYSSRVITTLSKNIEKANDSINTRGTGGEIQYSDDEASKDTNYNIRQNSNNITRNVVEVVRTNAQGILRGVYVTKEEVVDKQTVGVTIRWDTSSNRFGDTLKRQFGG